MRTLWFGGSFNPIHHGHLICARAVAEARGYDKVVLVPSAHPPHKPVATDLAAPHHRASMCELAVAGDPMFAVDRQELDRTGPSYTIDTVRALKAQGHTQVSWLIGADMVAILPTWHQAEQLVAEAELVLMARPGWSFDFDHLPRPYRALAANVVEAPLIGLSATLVRRRVARGNDVRYLVPPAVQRYIADERLYR